MTDKLTLERLAEIKRGNEEEGLTYEQIVDLIAAYEAQAKELAMLRESSKNWGKLMIELQDKLAEVRATHRAQMEAAAEKLMDSQAETKRVKKYLDDYMRNAEEAADK